MTLSLVEQAQRRGTSAVAVGISTAGVIDESSGTARHGANLRWRNTALGRHLEERTGLPATVLQDARAAAQAEAVLGAGRDTDNFFMVILGTGVGGAVIIDGQPLLGAHSLAGEIGHFQLDPAGASCGCGGRGCLEMVASGTALSRRYAEATGRLLPAEAVLDLVIEGDPIATGLWSDAVSGLSVAVAAAVAVLDVELVIFGGGMAAAGQLLLDPLAQELARARDPGAATTSDRCRPWQRRRVARSGCRGAAIRRSRPAGSLLAIPATVGRRARGIHRLILSR